MEKVFEISNPCFMLDTFVFKEKTFEVNGKKEKSTAYLVINGNGKIEQATTMLEERLRCGLEELMKSSNIKEASERNRMLLESFGDEFWYGTYYSQKHYYANLKVLWARQQMNIGRMNSRKT